MEGLRFEDQGDYSAVARLLDIARNQTGGQARRVADFLLAWHHRQWKPARERTVVRTDLCVSDTWR